VTSSWSFIPQILGIVCAYQKFSIGYEIFLKTFSCFDFIQNQASHLSCLYSLPVRFVILFNL